MENRKKALENSAVLKVPQLTGEEAEARGRAGAGQGGSEAHRRETWSHGSNSCAKSKRDGEGRGHRHVAEDPGQPAARPRRAWPQGMTGTTDPHRSPSHARRRRSRREPNPEVHSQQKPPFPKDRGTGLLRHAQLGGRHRAPGKVCLRPQEAQEGSCERTAQGGGSRPRGCAPRSGPLGLGAGCGSRAHPLRATCRAGCRATPVIPADSGPAPPSRLRAPSCPAGREGTRLTRSPGVERPLLSRAGPAGGPPSVFREAPRAGGESCLGPALACLPQGPFNVETQVLFLGSILGQQGQWLSLPRAFPVLSVHGRRRQAGS